MIVKKVIEKLQSLDKFKEWQKEHKDNYLTHLFKMIDNLNIDTWQIGYYNADSNKMTTFVLKGDELKIIPNEEIFQKVKVKVKELIMDNVKIDLEKSLDTAEEHQKKKYAGNESSKTMLVLQNIAGHIVYNVTFITQAFNTLNIKIDAIDGKVISSELNHMLKFQGKDA